MKPIIFYHGKCLDGFTGAWVAWKKFGTRAEYRPLSHEHQRVPSGIRGRDVFFIDYCFPSDLFDRVRRSAARTVVIDHHISNRDIVMRADEYLFSLTRSGCVLAWRYFFPKKKTPPFLLTVQDHDLFTLRRKKTLEIVTALALCEQTFLSWDRLIRRFELSQGRRSLETLGSFLLQYKDAHVTRLLDIAEPVTFHGVKAFAVNTHVFYSEVGTRIYKTLGVHLGIIWYAKNGKIKVSLRSDGTVDCAKLARSYGGGGHVGAAAFWLERDWHYPWKQRANNT